MITADDKLVRKNAWLVTGTTGTGWLREELADDKLVRKYDLPGIGIRRDSRLKEQERKLN